VESQGKSEKPRVQITLGMEVGQIAIKFRVKKENGWIEGNLPTQKVITRSPRNACIFWISNLLA
jgi:hypothetical protein